MNENIKRRKIFTYQELKKIPIGAGSEEKVSANQFDKSILMRPWDNYFDNDILVRETLARKLAKINAKLQNGQKLLVTFGYRPIKVQTKLFEREFAKIKARNPRLPNEELFEKTHILVAAPEVAGHPSGGAVDVTIINRDGEELEMGTRIADFSDEAKLATFSKKVTAGQLKNRLLLHDLMISENFAPFYGEWWHFSYGDREWAAFYGEASSIYG
jgi:D-alanyl-D-alanine dipeptidase